MANPYSIGRDCALRLVWQGARVQLDTVTGFSSQQETSVQRSDPLNSTPIEFNTPKGWRGEFMVDRADSGVDDLIASIEANFWQGGQIGSGVIYQTITETDGSTTQYEYVGVSLTLTSAGTWQAEGIVKQRLSFFASLRNKLS